MGKSSKSKLAAAEDAAPSLSSFLLSTADQKDSQLDNIFSNSKGPSLAFKADSTEGKKVKKDKKEKKDKKKKEEVEPVAVVEPEPISEDDEEEVENDAELSELDSDEQLDLDDDEEEEEEDEEDEDDGVKEAYAAKLVAARLKALAASSETGAKPTKNEKKRKATSQDVDDEEASSEEESGDDEELDLDDLVHESVRNSGKVVEGKEEKGKKSKKVVVDETPEEKDARTIFLGNVPVGCSTSRPLKKALIRHVLQSPTLLALLPPSFPPLKASTIRFRSLAFASTVFGRKPEDDKEPTEVHGRKRAREWRDSENTDERGVRGGFREKEKVPEVKEKTGNKGLLTDGQKRRVAFIKGELNEGKKACNAYLVLEHLPTNSNSNDGGSDLSISEIIDLIVSDVTGSTFEGFTLRGDRVRPRSIAATIAAAKTIRTSKSTPQLDPTSTPTSSTPSYTVPPAQARRTIFMGGLDFAENEENVRSATEKVLVKARGAPKSDAGGKGWVEGVRLIRDASTGLGKGFGYVLLRDPECVDELLALPFGQPLKVSKRKPRLERCKSGVAAARAKAASQAKASTPSTSGPPPPAFSKPRLSSSSSSSHTRPSTTSTAHQAKLAEALAKLPAEERKAIKAVDPERLWRRAQKKKEKVLKERHERKVGNGSKKDGGILGRETRGEERRRKEKKRVKEGNKTGKRAKF